jgi:membrane carboxypeptidase/penicillin-binding protein PbpC
MIEILTRLRYPNLSGRSEGYQKSLSSRLGLTIENLSIPERKKKSYIDHLSFFSIRIKKELRLFCDGHASRLDTFLLEDIPKDLCRRTDISLKSSLDLDLTLRASESLESILSALEKKNVHNGAIFAIEPRAKKVILYVGNRNNASSNASDMVRIPRSVGSSLKPFLYRMILEDGHDPDDLIIDETKVYETGVRDTSYISENYNPRSYGPVTLRDALGNSMNSAAVRLSEYLGIGRVYMELRKLGFPLEHDAGYYGYTLMLGGIELSLEEIVDGYRHMIDLKNKENFFLYDILSNEAHRSMTF